MAAIILADVEAVAPQVTAVPAAVLLWVNGNGLDPTAFDGEDGATTKLVRCLLAAHFAVSLGADGTNNPAQSGAVDSITEGGLSVGFTPPPITGTALATTAYGVQAWWLIRMSCGGGVLAEFPSGGGPFPDFQTGPPCGWPFNSGGGWFSG